MTGKDYLSQIKMLNRKINNKISELENLKSMTTGTGLKLNADKVQTSISQDKMGDLVCKIIDLQAEINDEIDNLIDLKQEIIRTIESINNPKIYDVLYMYYVEEKKWSEICDKTGFSQSWCAELKNKGEFMVYNRIKSRKKDNP